MPEITCGEAVIRVLEKAGVEVVFGVLSVHNLPFYEAISRRRTIRTVAARGEAGAVGMADGYARATGKLGVAITSTGVGAANAAGHLLEAFNASSPVLHLTGQVDSAAVNEERGALHGAKDQLTMLRSVGKDAYRIDDPAAAAAVTAQAIQQATSGRPGPVSIEVPVDLQYEPVPDDDVAVPPRARVPAPKSDISLAVAALARARRPLIWAGGGAVAADAAEQVRLLAERLGAGVLTTQAGRGALPESHPLCIGNFIVDATVAPLLAESDLLLAVGTRFRGNETRGWHLKLPEPLLRVDADADIARQNYAPDIALVGDAQATLQALLDALPADRTGNDAWRTRLGEVREAARARWRSTLGPHERLLDDLRATLPKDAVVVRDVTVPATTWGSRLIEVEEPRGQVHSSSMAIGQGLPMAIGAAIGRPDRTVVLLAGDGGYPITMGELPVAVEEKLKLLIVLFNDAGYGILRNLQDAYFEGKYFGVDLLSPDFARTTEAMGGWGCRVASTAELAPSLREALAQEGPSMVEIDLRAIGPMAQPFVGAARLVPERAGKKG